MEILVCLMVEKGCFIFTSDFKIACFFSNDFGNADSRLLQSYFLLFEYFDFHILIATNSYLFNLNKRLFQFNAQFESCTKDSRALNKRNNCIILICLITFIQPYFSNVKNYLRFKQDTNNYYITITLICTIYSVSILRQVSSSFKQLQISDKIKNIITRRSRATKLKRSYK